MATVAIYDAGTLNDKLNRLMDQAGLESWKNEYKRRLSSGLKVMNFKADLRKTALNNIRKLSVEKSIQELERGLKAGEKWKWESTTLPKAYRGKLASSDDLYFAYSFIEGDKSGLAKAAAVAATVGKVAVVGAAVVATAGAAGLAIPAVATGVTATVGAAAATLKPSIDAAKTALAPAADVVKAATPIAEAVKGAQSSSSASKPASSLPSASKAVAPSSGGELVKASVSPVLVVAVVAIGAAFLLRRKG